MICLVEGGILSLLAEYGQHPLGYCRFGAIYHTYKEGCSFYRGDSGLLCLLGSSLFVLGDFATEELGEFAEMMGVSSISGEKGRWAEGFEALTTVVIRLDEPKVYKDTALDLFPERRAVYQLLQPEMEGEIDLYLWMGDVAIRQRMGTGVFGLYHQFSTASMLFIHQQYGILGGVATHKDHRHKGMATRAITALMGALPQCKVVLGVTQSRELLPFYQGLGFRAIGEHCYVEL